MKSREKDIVRAMKSVRAATRQGERRLFGAAAGRRAALEFLEQLDDLATAHLVLTDGTLADVSAALGKCTREARELLVAILDAVATRAARRLAEPRYVWLRRRLEENRPPGRAPEMAERSASSFAAVMDLRDAVRAVLPHHPEGDQS